MDIRKIKKLIEIIEESDIAEIEISEGEESVRISRLTAPVQVVRAYCTSSRCSNACCCYSYSTC